MKSLKIAFLMTQSLDSPSGLGRYGPLARELAQRGHQVEIFALHPDIISLDETNYWSEEVNVRYVAPMHVIKRGSSKSYYSSVSLIRVAMNATWQLTHAAYNSSAEIIQICKPHPMNSLAGLYSHTMKNKALFLDCDDYETGLGHFTATWQKAVVGYFEKRVPKHVQVVTTNTHFMQKKLESWGVSAEKIYYLPNGVEIERFKKPPLEQARFLRENLGLQNRKVISYIGTLGFASHPVNLLIDAFAIVHLRIPNSTLLIVGGGEDFEKIKSQAQALGIANAVQFIGRVPPDQVPLYYAISDVSIDPVYDDDAARGRSPLKLFESWACGVPFVTADVGDRRWLLGDPPAGLMANPGDPTTLGDCILQILTDPSLASELARRGSERISQFTWDRLAVGLENLYLQVCGHFESDRSKHIT